MRISQSLAVALTLSCVAVTAAPAPAAAYTLLDMLRGNVKNGKLVTKPETTEQFAPPESTRPLVRDVAPAPTPTVVGPKYFTYKPDPMRRVNLSTKAPATDATMTTGSVSSASDPKAFLASANVMAPKTIAPVVEDYYKNGGDLVWIENNAINDRARAALKTLADAGVYGLDPADYTVNEPALTGNADEDAKALATFEVTLSARVLSYVEDAKRGRVDPNRISDYYDIKRKSVDLAPVLKLLRNSPDVSAYLVSRQPNNARFVALKDELARLRAADGNGQHVKIDLGDRLLRPGMNNPEIANVIAAIQHRGSDALKTEFSAVLAAYDGSADYTPELADVVKAFQKDAGLKPDGVIGNATVRALVGDSNDAKIEKLIVAMEEIRWLPDDLGSRFVFINQPAFTASYYNDSKPQFSMRVVVGSKQHQTYFFQDEIETVEVNPYWGVPQSIIINEMLPKLRSDPNYLDRLGYQVEVGGRPVASSAVNWYGSTQNVAVRQPPSSDNALGELKILFPNSHAIYMHDTPSKSFFKRDMRALSHGCVRLAEPRRMAAAVLGVSEADVGQQIASGKNRALPVTAKIPVYVSYFTAWPDEDGKVHYFGDVYDRDNYLGKAFSATTSARQQS